MIRAETIAGIAQEVADAGLSEQCVSSLRTRYPDLHFTYCMDDDVNAAMPYLQFTGFNVYLIDGRDHCLKLTQDTEAATGLVLAETFDDV